jgi:hypothetical protein
LLFHQDFAVVTVLFSVAKSAVVYQCGKDCENLEGHSNFYQGSGAAGKTMAWAANA